MIWEPIVFAVLLGGSAGLFLESLGAKLRIVQQGAPERSRLDHLGTRLRVALREVLLQTRVIEGRPVVGALHTVVFFGFMLFALESAEMALGVFGIPFLEPLLGGALPTFRVAMSVVAVLVTVAILGLAFRRFVMVRTSPDPKSWTSAVVAVFIVLLMVTYLNEVQPEPFAPHANWWLHMGILLVFPHLILRSKHFHILLAPVNVFLREERLGDYPTLDLEALAEAEGEVTLGLETVASLPWKLRLDFYSCVECRRCTDECPAARQGNNPLDPRGFVLDGRRTIASCAPGDAVIGNVISDAALGYCVTCGACENACPVGVEHLQLLVGAKRAQALATGQGVVASEFFRAIEVHGNALGRPKQERKALVSELGMPRFTGAEDQWLLWMGCVWGYNRSQRGVVEAFQETLSAAGVDYGVLDDEPCCGHHSRRQGEETQFQDLARRSIEALKGSGARRVVTPCPHCLHTLRHELAPLDGELALEVVHHSDLLARLVAAGSLQLDGGAEKTVAAFHDPCYLARYEGEHDAPRAVLAAAGVSLRELPHRRERTLCCGGGAAGFAREQRVDGPRRAEVTASGAKLLVTACPECRMMLDATVEQTKDIAEIVARSMRARRGLPPVGTEGGLVTAETPANAELEGRILTLFALHPQEEMQLLDVAARAHISGRLADLRKAADHLAATGKLRLARRGGGRYYQLGDVRLQPGAEASAPTVH